MSPFAADRKVLVSRLNKAVEKAQKSRSVPYLRNAIKQAQDAGVQGADLDYAREKLFNMQQTQNASSDLKVTLSHANVRYRLKDCGLDELDQLKDEIVFRLREAQRSGQTTSRVVLTAKTLLQRMTARSAVLLALEGGCLEELAEALGRAEAMGLTLPEERRRLAEWRKCQAELAEACCSGHVGQLQQIARRAQDLGLRSPELARVERIAQFQVGQRVWVGAAAGHAATVRYFGPTDFGEGDWVGVEFDEPVGRHDGEVDGKRFFTCAEGHGRFVRPQVIRLLPDFDDEQEEDEEGDDAPGKKSDVGRLSQETALLRLAEHQDVKPSEHRKRYVLKGSPLARSDGFSDTGLATTAGSRRADYQSTGPCSPWAESCLRSGKLSAKGRPAEDAVEWLEGDDHRASMAVHVGHEPAGEPSPGSSPWRRSGGAPQRRGEGFFQTQRPSGFDLQPRASQSQVGARQRPSSTGRLSRPAAESSSDGEEEVASRRPPRGRPSRGRGAELADELQDADFDGRLRPGQRPSCQPQATNTANRVSQARAFSVPLRASRAGGEEGSPPVVPRISRMSLASRQTRASRRPPREPEGELEEEDLRGGGDELEGAEEEFVDAADEARGGMSPQASRASRVSRATRASRASRRGAWERSSIEFVPELVEDFEDERPVPVFGSQPRYPGFGEGGADGGGGGGLGGEGLDDGGVPWRNQLAGLGSDDMLAHELMLTQAIQMRGGSHLRSHCQHPPSSMCAATDAELLRALSATQYMQSAGFAGVATGDDVYHGTGSSIKILPSSQVVAGSPTGAAPGRSVSPSGRLHPMIMPASEVMAGDGAAGQGQEAWASPRSRLQVSPSAMGGDTDAHHRSILPAAQVMTPPPPSPSAHHPAIMSSSMLTSPRPTSSSPAPAHEGLLPARDWGSPPTSPQAGHPMIFASSELHAPPSAAGERAQHPLIHSSSAVMAGGAPGRPLASDDDLRRAFAETSQLVDASRPPLEGLPTVTLTPPGDPPLAAGAGLGYGGGGGLVQPADRSPGRRPSVVSATSWGSGHTQQTYPDPAIAESRRAGWGDAF